MEGTDLMQAIERTYKQPLKDVLLNLYLKHDGCVAAIAAEIGVSRGTLWTWRRQVGLSNVDIRQAMLQQSRTTPTTIGATE